MTEFRTTTAHLLCNQGEQTVRVVKLTTIPEDLASLTLECQMRRTIESKEVVLEPAVALKDETTGEIEITITTAEAEKLTGVYVFDVKGKDGSEALRLIEGTFRFKPQVTRTIN